MKKVLVVFAVLVLLALSFLLADYFDVFNVSSPTVVNESPVPAENNSQVTTSPGTEDNPSLSSVPYRVETFVSNLDVPWSIVFTSPDRIFVTERDGLVRLIENGVVREEPMVSFTVSTRSEEGLMGLTLDQDYATNKYVYACYAYVSGNGIADRLVRMVDEGTRLRVERTLLEGIPAAQYHAGCRIKFGPDKKLYVTTGDATERNLAQDRNSLAGKILRLNNDGSIPADNPFPNSAVWSFGHRNPQGIAWHPTSGELWSTEHGPSGNDGPGGGDEVNRIEKGANYGWPVVSHDRSREGMISPLITHTPAVAPASAEFYTGDVFPQFSNNFFYTGLRGEGLFRVVVSENGTQVVSREKLSGVSVGRVRDVVTGPDGFIYFSSSNRDGRGRINSGDDKIYRLVPQQ